LKVLLIGGLGFIGKHVIRTLPTTCEVVVFSDPETADQTRSFAEEYHVRVYRGDVTNLQSVRDVFQKESPNVVIHLAALTGLAKCNQNPALAFSVNVFGTHNVILGCVAANSKLIFISSREVYGETGHGLTSESSPLVPNNVYGLTKMLAEELVLWAHSRHQLNYTILRLTNVYGPEGDQYNIQAMVKSGLSTRVIPIMGGSQSMNFVYVGDVAVVIRTCMENPNASNEIFNVGSKDNLTVEEIVTQVAIALGSSIKIERKSMREGETITFRPSLEKIERKLDYKPKTTFADNLKTTIAWYKSDKSFV
jgi:UDP-glucose 4-epimerase